MMSLKNELPEIKETIAKSITYEQSVSVVQTKNIKRAQYIYKLLMKNGYNVELISGLSTKRMKYGDYRRIAISPQFARGKIPLTDGVIEKDKIKGEIDLLLKSLQWQKIENAIEESGIEN
jgi:hypothetical protein